MEFIAPQIQSIALLVIFITWSLVWKGIALWKSAQSGRKTWFIILLIANTFGVLEILYIFVIHPHLDKKSQKVEVK